MKIDRFEDIIAWQKAKELTYLIYKEFETSKDFGFKDQIQRASVSIMNNIAEGFEQNQIKNLNTSYLLQKVHLEKSDQCYT